MTLRFYTFNAHYLCNLAGAGDNMIDEELLNEIEGQDEHPAIARLIELGRQNPLSPLTTF